MPDTPKDLINFIAATIHQLHCQFQRFMTNLHDFHNQLEEDNDNLSIDEIASQIDYTDTILNDIHSAIQELSITWNDLNEINNRLKNTLPPEHPLRPNDTQNI